MMGICCVTHLNKGRRNNRKRVRKDDAEIRGVLVGKQRKQK
jgi:hypothetical protein